MSRALYIIAGLASVLAPFALTLGAVVLGYGSAGHG